MDNTEPSLPGWYVIENPHRDPARVVSGPKDRDSAESHANFLADPNAKIMNAPALVFSIQDQGYNVEWSDQAEKPSSLKDSTDRGDE